MPVSKKRHKKGRPGPAKKITVLKVNPFNRTIAQIFIKPSTQGVRGILGMGILRHHVILNDVNGEKLVGGVRTGLGEDGITPEWRIRGCENYAGIGILFGSRNGSMEFMGSCPADIAWAVCEIVWCEAGETSSAAEVRKRLGLPEPENDETQQGAAEDGGK